MDRYAIFIDAGYAYAGGGELVLDARNRNEVVLHHTRFLARLRAIIDQHFPQSGDFLRVYWYDAAPNAIPLAEHEAIAAHPGVKLRLGRLTRAGQKGVDSLVLRDMMKLASEHAICTAFLLAGDEDLRQGVIEAQDYGVKVILLGIAPTLGQNQAEALVHEADDHRVLEYDDLQDCFGSRLGSIDESFDTADAAYAFGLEWAAGHPALVAMAMSGDFLPREADMELIRRIIQDADLPAGVRLPFPVLQRARAAFRSALATGAAAVPVAPEIAPTSVPADTVVPVEEPPAATAPGPVPPVEEPAVAPPPRPLEQPMTPFGVGEAFGREWLDDQPQDEVRYVRANFPYVPRDVDIELLKRLVASLGLAYGTFVEDGDRKAARAGFWEALGLELDYGQGHRTARPTFEPIAERDPVAFGKAFAGQWIDRTDAAEVERARGLANRGIGLPFEADAQLLRAATAVFGDPVPVAVRHRLREGFVNRITA
jgi:uncharacterized LabA/DUF88 family protein